MTLIPITCEARIMGFKKESRADGDWTELRIHIHPDDTPHALFLLPLKTHIMLSIKGTDEGAAETADEYPTPEATETPEEPAPDTLPLKERRPWDEISLREQACIRCNDHRFGEWIAKRMHLWGRGIPTDELLRRHLGISSRRDLDSDEELGNRWLHLDSEYRASQRGETPEEFARQIAKGPR